VIYVTDQSTPVIVGLVLIDGSTILLPGNVKLSFMVVVTRMETISKLKQNVPDNVKVSFYYSLWFTVWRLSFLPYVSGMNQPSPKVLGLVA
jgi:hypothetical protein